MGNIWDLNFIIPESRCTWNEHGLDKSSIIFTNLLQLTVLEMRLTYWKSHKNLVNVNVIMFVFLGYYSYATVEDIKECCR